MANTTLQRNAFNAGNDTVGNIRNNTKDFTKFSYFLGGIDVTHQNLDQFTPYIRGVSRIFMHKPPQFMLVMYPEETRNFKTYVETGYTSIDGINDITVDYVDFEGGFAGQRFRNVSLSRDEMDTFTIQLYELSGSPVREYLDLWISGVRDPRSGIAHYHGAIESTTNHVPYSEMNHTSEFIYVNLDPTARFCEYVCMLAHCFPSKVPKNHLNYSTGERGNAQVDLEFNCTKYESPKINDVGRWYINNSKVNYNYLDFDPGILKDGDGLSNTNRQSDMADITAAGYNLGFTYDYGTGSGTAHGPGVVTENENGTFNAPNEMR